MRFHRNEKRKQGRSRLRYGLIPAFIVVLHPEKQVRIKIIDMLKSDKDEDRHFTVRNDVASETRILEPFLAVRHINLCMLITAQTADILADFDLSFDCLCPRDAIKIRQTSGLIKISHSRPIVIPICIFDAHYLSNFYFIPLVVALISQILFMQVRVNHPLLTDSTLAGSSKSKNLTVIGRLAGLLHAMRPAYKLLGNYAVQRAETHPMQTNTSDVCTNL
jgi:hypothetical protein